MADFLRHEPCELCGSSDGKAIYSDGSTYCFVCEKAGKADDMKQTQKPEPKVRGAMITNGTIR